MTSDKSLGGWASGSLVILVIGCAAPEVGLTARIRSESDTVALVRSAGPRLVEFSLLTGFDYVEPPPPTDLATADLDAVQPSAPSVVPGDVLTLDGQLIRLRGFMVPLNLEAGQVSSFLLLADHKLCCGAGEPRVNDMVEVATASPVPFHADVRVEVRGRFEVGAVFEHGYLTSLYRIVAETVTVVGGGPQPPGR